MNKLQLLLIEDDPEDVELTREVLQRCGFRTRLQVAANGNDALAYLYKNPDAPGGGRPDLILLDLNMPCMDGVELLRRIKTDDSLKSIPVIIFTTSSTEKDLKRCSELGADGFVTKPVGLDQFDDVAKKIEALCELIAALPDKS